MRLISVITFNFFPMFAKNQKFFADLITRRFETNLNGVYMFCKIKKFLTGLMTVLSLTKKKY